LTINAWLRDGAPIDSTTLLPVAVGTSSGTALRAAYYSTNGTLITAASGSALHPCLGGIIELANILESAPNSGFWTNQAGVALTGDGTHPTQLGHYLGGACVAGLITNGILV
jgi:hypothetical protein